MSVTERRQEAHNPSSDDQARATARAALRQLDAPTLARLADGHPFPLPGVPELEREYGSRAVGVWVSVVAEAELAGREEVGV